MLGHVDMSSKRGARHFSLDILCCPYYLPPSQTLQITK